MSQAKGYAARTAGAKLEPFSFQRREPRERDVRIEIRFCGVCHSDIHQARDEWGGALFPMVPGHEIVGRVTEVGSRVTRFKVGDTAGVGCLVDSCRTCGNCREGLEQYCPQPVFTYNGREKDGTPTYGGYANEIVVEEDFVLKVPQGLDLSRVAPLLCAGITTYSPLRQWGVGKGSRVGVVGLGGLGHMAVKLAASFGAEVTVLSTSPKKEADAKRLGAHHFVVTRDPAALKPLAEHFDFILDSVSAPHDINQLAGLLKRDGTLTLVGVPPESTKLNAFPLIHRRRRLAGSLIGGLPETQEMLDYCGRHEVMADVEVIPVKAVNDAYERMLKGDVRYRFVLDMATL